MPRPDGRPAAVVYDWDNTLVDTWPVIHAALVTTFEAMGHAPWTFEETKDRVSHSLRDAFPVLFGDRWEIARDHYYAAFEAQHLKALAPLPGARDMLDALSAAGVPQFVVSNKTGRFLRAEVSHLGWDALFKATIGAGDAPRDKPDPAALEMALAPAGLMAGKSVWFVGDSRSDLELAHRAGCRGILIHPDAGRAAAFADVPPDLHFPDLMQLRDVIGVG